MLAGVLVGAPAAWADGDPASDVLVAAPPIFLPPDSGATYVQKLALSRQLATAQRRGHPLRVAVIATRSDLGSVGALWGDPARYARFLGDELSLNYRGELLVVMPDGFAVARDGAPVRTALQGLAPRRAQLVTATEQAITRLTGVASEGTRSLAAAAGAPRTSGISWWATTAAAAMVVALAWTVSLRRRPLRGRRRLADHEAS